MVTANFTHICGRPLLLAVLRDDILELVVVPGVHRVGLLVVLGAGVLVDIELLNLALNIAVVRELALVA